MMPHRYCAVRRGLHMPQIIKHVVYIRPVFIGEIILSAPGLFHAVEKDVNESHYNLTGIPVAVSLS